MLNLKVDNKTIDIKYNYRLYINIVGKDVDKQAEKFDAFLAGLLNDRVDSILDFGVAATSQKLSMEQVADQLDEQDVFDDVHATTEEILNGMCTAGFLTSKVQEWKKYAGTMLEEFEKMYDSVLKKNSKLTKKEQTEKQDELDKMKSALEELKSQVEIAKERLNIKNN